MKSISFVFIVSIISIFTSCVTKKQLFYFDSLNNESKLSPIHSQEIKIRPYDLLDIHFSSVDPSSIAIFNKSVGGNTSPSVNEASIYLKSYLVDSLGYVSLPILGDIYVEGYSIREITEKIDDKIKLYYKMVSVDVKLMSYRLIVLGETAVSGTKLYYNPNVTIFQVIADFGGFTDYANKKKIYILRREAGVIHKELVNLQSPNLISSDFYYLKPNDIIYIEPLKSKLFKINSSVLGLILTSTSLAVLLLNIFKI